VATGPLNNDIKKNQKKGFCIFINKHKCLLKNYLHLFRQKKNCRNMAKKNRKMA